MQSLFLCTQLTFCTYVMHPGRIHHRPFKDLLAVGSSIFAWWLARPLALHFAAAYGRSRLQESGTSVRLEPALYTMTAKRS